MADADLTDKIRRRMKITKSNRFNYAKRLEKKAASKALSISLLSVACVSASIYLLAFADSLDVNVSRLIGFLVASASVYSLILSGQSSATSLARRANDAHRCAREISHLYRKLEVERVDLAETSIRYEKIISSYPENHDRIDLWKTYYEESIESKDLVVGPIKGEVPYWFSCHFSLIATTFFLIVEALLVCFYTFPSASP